MGDQSALLRQWTTLRLLCARRLGTTIKEIAAEQGVGEKTVRRDLETLRNAGFPLEETVEQFGRKKWQIRSDKGQPGLSFAFDEAIALYLGRRFLEPLAGTVFWEAAQRAFRKVRASLGPDALRYTERFAAVFYQTMAGTSDYSQKADLIDQLMIGIEDRRAVFLTYQSLRATEPVTYDVYPYGLAYHRRALYLIGRSPQHDAIRHWKIDRIEKADLTELRFPRPDDFDLPTHLAHSFGIYQGAGPVHLKLRFHPPVVRYVAEHRWHPSQRLAPQPDGTLLMEIDLDSTEEIKHWVLGFGKNAEVLEPESLRCEIRDELRTLLESLDRPPTATKPAAARRNSGKERKE